jgi:hypothetical protein
MFNTLNLPVLNQIHNLNGMINMSNLALNMIVRNLTSLRDAMNHGLEVILELLTLKHIPLEARWETYERLVSKDILTKIDLYHDGFVEVLNPNFTLYDHFYVERHSTQLYTVMYDQICDKELDNEIVEKWQELVLASGHAGFIYDW